jgi:hypothetical protein
VRAEEKELEGPELEREERTHEPAEHEVEELPELGGEELRDIELPHRSTLFEALRLVLAGEEVRIDMLYLPQRETRALEALQAAVTGHDSVGEFVFADDRRALLEQALAVLQQNVTHGEPEQLAELHAKFDELTAQVGELRARLLSLEDAQEDILEDKVRWVAEAAADGDDKPKPGPPEDAALEGPERPATPKPASTLEGPERPAPPKPVSTLEGPERPAPPKPASTLHGDPPAESPRPPSELAAESAAAAAEAKPPWWRRLLG